MIVDVTQEHIDQGSPEEGTDCPVALALREMPNVKYAWVGDDVEVKTYEDGRYQDRFY